MRKKLLASLAVFIALLALAPHQGLRAFLPAWNKALPADGGAFWAPDIRSNWDAIARTIGSVNLLADTTFLIWPAGDTVVPSHYTLVNAPGITRTGTGLGDTDRKHGAFAVKLVTAASLGSLRQNIVPSGTYDDGFDGLTLSFGAWVKATVNAVARIGIGDGVGTSYSADHSGSGAWVWLTGTRVVNSSATQIYFTFECNASQTCRISAPTVLFGEVPPAYPQPAPIINGQTTCFIAGTQTVSDRKIGCDRYFDRPTLIKGASLAVQTAPVPAGSDLIVDLDHYDGAVFQPLYSTSASPAGRPRIIAGSATGASYDPDATTYRPRCFDAFLTTSQTDRLLVVNVDQIGSTNPGIDLYVHIRYMQYARPLEPFLRDTDVN